MTVLTQRQTEKLLELAREWKFAIEVESTYRRYDVSSERVAYPWGEIKSEHCGSEWVTGAVDWNNWKENRGRLQQDLDRYITVNSSTGGHVHIDWSHMVELRKSKRTLLSLGVLIRQMNKYIQELLETDADRRRMGFTNKFDDHYIELLENLERMYEQSSRRTPIGTFPRFWIAISRIRRSQTFQNNTIEYRVFDSSNQVEKLEQNVAFALAFTLFARFVPDMEELCSYFHQTARTFRCQKHIAECLFNEITQLQQLILADVLPEVYNAPEVTYAEAQ